MLFPQFTLALTRGCALTVMIVVGSSVAGLTSHAQPNTNQATNSALTKARQQLGHQQFAAAEKTLREALAVNEQQGQAWYLLGYAIHAQNRMDEALKVHRRAAEFPAVRGKALYNAACVYARRNQAELAIKTLNEAFDAGFANRGMLANDSDFDAIRKDARFQALVPALLTGEDLFVEPVRILHAFDGEAANDQFGWVARRIGDVDQDGAQDFVATSPTYQQGAGKAYVYSSRTGKLLHAHLGKAGERLGNGAAAAGDVDADGSPDVIVGAPSGNAAYAWSGRDGRLLWRLTGVQPNSSFGYKVSGIHDVNQDGHDDLVVSATKAHGAAAASGCCYLYSGRDGKLLYTLPGERSGDLFGSAVAGTWEQDQHLLAVGAQNAGTNQGGQVYVYRLGPQRAKLLFKVTGDKNSRNLGQMFVSFPGDLDGDEIPDVYASDFSDSTFAPGAGRIRVVSGADGRELLSVTGEQAGEGLGTSPSDAGDVNGDGIPDLVVGAWQNAQGAPSGGKVRVFSGKDGTTLQAWTCCQSGDTFGFDATGLGDINGDGRVDFLLTSAWSPVAGPKTGRVFIISAR